MQDTNTSNKDTKEEAMLSTLDNPFNPFHKFDLWNQYDRARGYNTLAYLGRIVDYSECVNEEQKRKERERAMDEIIHLNPLGIYCKVLKNEKVKPINLTREK